MRLYYIPQLSSLSSHIALREAGVAFDLVKVDAATKTLPDGTDYLKLNPLGYVPLLELDDGQLLSEGAAILQYVADLRPDAGLAPAAGGMARYRLQEWLSFINSELHRFCAALYNGACAGPVEDGLRRTVASRLARVASRLAGQDWLMGERFSVADAYLFTVLAWCPHLGIDLSPWPVLRDFVARAMRRPAVLEALRAEGV